MSYDNWKLRSPDDEYWYDDEPPECDHEDFDIDILTGRAECVRCAHTWMATDEEIAHQVKLEEDWTKEAKRQARPWNRLWRRWRNSRACRWLVLTLIYQRYSKWRFNRNYRSVDIDDDIPF